MEHTRTISREFATGAKAVLHLEGRSGSVIVEGRESDVVVVEAVVRVWADLSSDADDAATLVERNMEQDAHRVIVRAPSLQPKKEKWVGLIGRGPRIDYHVRVPRNTAVRVLSRSGAVQIRSTEGLVHSEASSGRIDIQDVRGDVTVASRSGAVTLERIDGDVTAGVRSGRFRLMHISGSARIEARSGSIELDDIAGDVRLDARSGTVSIDAPGGKVWARTRAGAVRFKGRVQDDVDIEAHAGAIQFAVDPAYPFFLDAESHGGSVRSDLPPRRNGAQPAAGGPKVRLRTRAGAIRITRA